MIDYASLYAQMEQTPLANWLEQLPEQIAAALHDERHGRLPQWREILKNLPNIKPSKLNLHDGVIVGQPDDLTAEQFAQMESQLRLLHPWRKGPFDLFGLHIDTEWCSDWKWDRLKDGIAPLDGRLVLDVGCGNGYHCWRMAGAGAKLVIGLDPFLLYVAQYQAIRHFVGNNVPAHVLPLGVEQLPNQLAAFDTVFSMGVLYHRRSPMDHLITLREALRPGGELVLETLIIEGEAGQVLVPEGRYAQMRNVWFIPTVPTLLGWLRKCGFVQEKVLDVTPTTVEEQRSTKWMTFNSLPDFLDKEDSNRTVEGYPAPVRAIVVAKRPYSSFALKFRIDRTRNTQYAIFANG
ncbi:tRNA 5-methoxyuridine(34)/uridine 5-oxyacetic acid(34) synthase CmoB [Candidatus Leptofilum sp.]|uniref:tRNA 5-methoxyuridine(34)/uridine 5-oxyacetic acid(34) synthase CmoB n=1 Tax=Candidatus Leptofilum sp. TaxID=3241576 RepID=UPI003B59D140